ncbi:MAG: 23S rRNA (uracil(1939)-C(5))-methyltransferase RlmD [Geminicoccales bacterium]
MSLRKRRSRQGRPAPRQKPDPAIGGDHDVEIETLGRGSDGIAYLDSQPIFVPLALPGDRLRVRLITKRGQGYGARVIQRHSLAERADPPCPHFERCGGCQLQHLPADDYHGWKVQQLRTALDQRGLSDITIRSTIEGHTEARRRVRLAFSPRHVQGSKKNQKKKPNGEITLGFREAQSHHIINIETCPITHPLIISTLEPLRKLLGNLDLAAKGGELHVTTTETGLDLLLETTTAPHLADLESLGSFAHAFDVARIVWRRDVAASPEPIAVRRPAMVSLGGIPLALPIGAFLQATEHAETAIREAVIEAIGSSQHVADLFSGCGTFGLPLAADGRNVIAFERAPAMVEAMKTAAKAAGIAQRLTVKLRDLERQPLDHSDLHAINAAIVDPPRAGAAPQATALAASEVEKIAMVSCKPTTFARDARTLIDGGYRLLWVQPIDAFLWSAEIELVAAFERAVPSC